MALTFKFFGKPGAYREDGSDVLIEDVRVIWMFAILALGERKVVQHADMAAIFCGHLGDPGYTLSNHVIGSLRRPHPLWTRLSHGDRELSFTKREGDVIDVKLFDKLHNATDIEGMRQAFDHYTGPILDGLEHVKGFARKCRTLKTDDEVQRQREKIVYSILDMCSAKRAANPSELRIVYEKKYLALLKRVVDIYVHQDNIEQALECCKLAGTRVRQIESLANIEQIQAVVPDDIRYELPEVGSTVASLANSSAVATETVKPIRQSSGLKDSIMGLVDDDSLSENIYRDQASDDIFRFPKLPHCLPGNLLFGRQTELTEITNELEQHRAVLVRGPAGIGKTELVLRVADEAHGQKRKAHVVYFDVEEVAREMPLPAFVRRQLMPHAGDHLETGASLAVLLSDLDILIVVDNAHARPHEVASMVLDLATTTGVWLLLASRLSLQKPGISELVVRGLGVPSDEDQRVGDGSDNSSVDYFDYIASSSHRDIGDRNPYQLTPTNASKVREICLAVDGVPLFIRMAATWAAKTSVELVYDKLRSSRFDVLNAGDAQDNHHHCAETLMTGLWTTLDRGNKSPVVVQTQDLSDQQLLLLRLTTLKSGASIDEVVTICAFDPLSKPVARTLINELEGQSLLRLYGNGLNYKIWFIHQTFEHFVRHKAATTEPATYAKSVSTTNLIKTYLSKAERLREQMVGVSQAAVLDQIGSDYGNYALAIDIAHNNEFDVEIELRFVSALARFWYLRGLAATGCATADRALSRVKKDIEFVTHVSALFNAGILAENMADYNKALSYSTEGLARATIQGDDFHIACFTIRNALARLCLGIPPHEILGDFSRAAAILRGYGNDRHTLESALGWLGYAEYLVGDLKAAMRTTVESLGIAREISNDQGIAECQMFVAKICIREGKPVESFVCLQETFLYLRKIKNNAEYADAFETAMAVHVYCNDFESARRAFNAARYVRSTYGTQRLSLYSTDSSLTASELENHFGYSLETYPISCDEEELHSLVEAYISSKYVDDVRNAS